MIDIITFGEALIDFVSTTSGTSLVDAPAFKKAFGGAPANVAIDLARLGLSVGFIGKVGDDDFGHFLAKVFEENGVNIENLVYDKTKRTTLAFVSLTQGGERAFMFYRNPGADMYLKPEEIKREFLAQARIFHFGSLSLTNQPSRNATYTAINIAKESGQIISFDPNLRPSLWESLEDARREIAQGLEVADILKVNEEELQFLTGNSDISSASAELLTDKTRLVFVSLGERGCYFNNLNFNGFVPAFSVKAVDTTGAGDGFVAGLLSELLLKAKEGIDFRNLHFEELAAIGKFANTVGTMITLKRGAISGSPTRAQVREFINEKSF